MISLKSILLANKFIHTWKKYITMQKIPVQVKQKIYSASKLRENKKDTLLMHV